MKDYTNSSIDKAAEIMESLSQSDHPMSLSQISKALSIPKASAFRILYSLEKWGVLEKVGEKEDYQLGKTLIYYGAKASKNMNIVTLSKDLIDRLSDEIQESVNLNIEYREFAVNIYKSTVKESGIVSNLIPISPLNCSSAGKVLLAQKSDQELQQYFKSDKVEERTIYSIMDAKTFENEKRTLLEKGVLYDNEEYEYGLLCIAAPIKYKTRVVAVVSLTGPKRRLEEKGVEALEQKLLHTVTKIIQELSLVGL